MEVGAISTCTVYLAKLFKLCSDMSDHYVDYGYCLISKREGLGTSL